MPNPNAETGDGTRAGPDDGPSSGESPQRTIGFLSRISRWQKVVGIIALLLVILFVVLQLTGVGGGLDHVPQPGPPPGGH